MDMNLMHSNYVFNYRKSSSCFVILICLVKVKSISLIPNICHLWNSKFPSVHADVFFQQHNVSSLLITFQRKYNYITFHIPSASAVEVKMSFESHWDCFNARYYVGGSLSKCCDRLGTCF